MLGFTISDLVNENFLAAAAQQHSAPPGKLLTNREGDFSLTIIAASHLSPMHSVLGHHGEYTYIFLMPNVFDLIDGAVPVPAGSVGE